MKRFILVFVLVMGLALPVMAQSDCGDGLPCGQLLWDLPPLPELQSPTPMPTFAVTVQATQVSGAVPTPPLVPTSPSIDVDTDGISDAISTLNVVILQTPVPILDLSGTPVDPSESFDNFGGDPQDFFAYAKGLSTVQFGSLSPLLVFSIASLATVIFVKSLTYMLPVVIALWGILRKIVSVVLDFIPG